MSYSKDNKWYKLIGRCFVCNNGDDYDGWEHSGNCSGLFYINDNPNDDKRQNVTFRYRCTIKENIEDINLTSKNSEEEEVSSIKWIPIDDIDNYKWAFNHDKIIKEEV